MVNHDRTVIGNGKDFWLFNNEDKSFDLTHPASHDADLIYPRVPIQTTTAKIIVDPAKTALVIIDMQNFFISPCLGRSRDSNGMKANEKLLKHAIPACRKAGIRVIWLNWGLTQEDIDKMPPATLRAFGFVETSAKAKQDGGDGDQEAATNDHSEEKKPTPKPAFGKDPRVYKGLGSEIGSVELEDGTTIDAGRLLMRDTWNAALPPDLEAARQAGMDGKLEREDVWIHKDRMSGLWGAETDCTKYLTSQGIKTLLFAGVNTDQCVGGSLQDAVTKGYDCCLLSDGCGTTSPQHAQDCIEYNTTRSWGFLLSCQDLEQAVEDMETT